MKELRSHRSVYDLKIRSAFTGPHRAPDSYWDDVILAFFIIVLICIFVGVI